jgi:hypothetical protein
LRCRFQEVVPLNAGNVLVIEDNEPAVRWLTLINQALNRPSPSDAEASSVSLSFATSPASALWTPSSGPLDPSLFHRSSHREVRRSAITRGRRLKSCTCPAEQRPRRSCRAPCLMGCARRRGIEGDAMTTSDDEEEEDVVVDESSSAAANSSDSFRRRERYCLVACKQMVGLFATVWARRELVPHVGHVHFSCVGRGIMGCLGNKGCISVSMSLHQTSLCFVRSHLASGEKEGDELRRNSDVVEIFKNTQFRRLCKRSGHRIPERILSHE